VFDLATGEIQGYEALTRFASGQRPDLVFEKAHSVGLGVEPETAYAVAAALAALDERPLVVEITEHVVVEDYAAVRDAVGSRPGVRISVDDAGAG